MKISKYETIGAAAIKKLIADFYQEIKTDEVLRPMYKDDLEAAEERLYLFMVQYLGGPDLYNQKRGLPKLKMRHMVFPVDDKAIEHWLNCMKTALDKSEIDEVNRSFLWHYFKQTAVFLKNR